MSLAPALPATEPVGWAYARWAKHYNACVDCQRDEWYGPLSGEPLFCGTGRDLFRQWVRLAQITVPLMGQNITRRAHDHAA